MFVPRAARVTARKVATPIQFPRPTARFELERKVQSPQLNSHLRPVLHNSARTSSSFRSFSSYSAFSSAVSTTSFLSRSRSTSFRFSSLLLTATVLTVVSFANSEHSSENEDGTERSEDEPSWISRLRSLSNRLMSMSIIRTADAASVSSPAPAPPPDSKSSAPVSVPVLPPSAPRWVHDLCANPDFRYHSLHEFFDHRHHLLYDALAKPNQVPHFFYFKQTQEADQTQKLKAAEASTAPQITSSSSSSPSTSSLFSSSASSVPSYTPEIRVIFVLGEDICGHRGIVHGGLIAALMDEVCGATSFATMGGGCFTANLNVNYHKPLRVNEYVLVRAKVVKVERRKIFVGVSVENGKGTVYANGTALFVKPKSVIPGLESKGHAVSEPAIINASTQ